MVHHRLLLAASLKDRKLILECYHPSAQYTEPYLFCDYLGTPGLSSEKEGQGSLYQDVEKDNGSGALRMLYSYFRPTRADLDSRTVRPHPAGDVPGSRTNPINDTLAPKAGADKPDLVSHNVVLDPHELFTQLSITAALVQVGPRRGVFLSFIDVVEKKTPRIWRDWLAEEAEKLKENKSIGDHSQKSTNEVGSTVWADEGKTLGMRVKVRERRWKRDVPLLVHRDEQQAVNYSLDIDGKMLCTISVICRR